MENELTDDVARVGDINLEGNIIPLEWFTHLKLESGKPDTNSILLLADIIYWYRPTTIRDELSGRIIGYKKKFRADLLQRGYKEFEELFGFSKKQIKEALQRLEKYGLLKRIFRNVPYKGTILANVMYIQIFPTKIKEITSKGRGGMDLKAHTSVHKCPHHGTQKSTPKDLEGTTYTKTTSKTTSNTSLSKKSKPKDVYEVLDFKEEREMMNIWDNIVKPNQKASIPSDTRCKKLKKILMDVFNEDIKEWENFCHSITESKFLMGEVTSFKATLDWCLNPENTYKVLEGNYTVGDKSFANKTNQAEDLTYEDQVNDNRWKEARKHIIDKLGIATFKTWIANIDLIEEKENIVYFKASGRFKAQYIENNYKELIITSWENSNGKIKDINISF